MVQKQYRRVIPKNYSNGRYENENLNVHVGYVKRNLHGYMLMSFDLAQFFCFCSLLYSLYMELNEDFL